MVYLVAGYILSGDQVRKYYKDNDLGEVTIAGTTLVVNRHLRAKNIPTRLLAVAYRKEPWYLFVTARRSDCCATECRFEPLEEDDRARMVKAQLQLDVGDIEFVTIANPYNN